MEQSAIDFVIAIVPACLPAVCLQSVNAQSVNAPAIVSAVLPNHLGLEPVVHVGLRVGNCQRRSSFWLCISSSTVSIFASHKLVVLLKNISKFSMRSVLWLKFVYVFSVGGDHSCFYSGGADQIMAPFEPARTTFLSEIV